MAGTEQPRRKILYLLKLFHEETDIERGVSMARIIEYLEQMGVPAERKSIYRDIRTLQETGFEIEKNRKRPVEYCLVNRTFDLAELRLLVDAMQSARFVSAEKTDKLIRKIESLAGRRLAGELNRQVHYSGRVKTSNDHIYFTTGTLHEAIAEGVRVTCKYTETGFDKIIKQRRSGESYEISPYDLVWNEDKYYLIGYYERYNKVCSFRMDRMQSVTMTAKPIFPKPEDYEINNYIRSAFSMYAGESVFVDIRFDNSLSDVIYDRFGKDTPVHKSGPDHFIAHVQVAISPVFFGWLFQFGAKAVVLRPERIANAYLALLDEVRDANATGKGIEG